MTKETEKSEIPVTTEESSALPKASNMSRRTLCYGVAGVAALCAMGGLRFVGSKSLLRPPGGQDETALIGACIRCQKCVEVCPRGVIVPAHVEDGILGMRTPTLRFRTDYCNFCQEENNGAPLCVQVCPTKALNLPEGANEKNTIIGVAKIFETDCLAYRLTGCKFCSDACPYDAISLDPQNRPIVDEKKCNGCGACEAVCVSLKEGSVQSGTSRRAIYIEPLA